MILIRLLGEKLQKSWERPPELRVASSVAPPSSPPSAQSHHQQQLVSCDFSNLSTVAVFPLSSAFSTSAFTLELLHALGRVCDEGEPAARLTREAVMENLGQDAFDKSQDFR